MAKIYLLSDEHIKNGQRPKTPRQKMRNWKILCLSLAALVLIEHIVVLTYMVK